MCRLIVLPLTLTVISAMATVSLARESKLPDLLIAQPTTIMVAACRVKMSYPKSNNSDPAVSAKGERLIANCERWAKASAYSWTNSIRKHSTLSNGFELPR